MKEIIKTASALGSSIVNLGLAFANLHFEMATWVLNEIGNALTPEPYDEDYDEDYENTEIPIDDPDPESEPQPEPEEDQDLPEDEKDWEFLNQESEEE